MRTLLHLWWRYLYGRDRQMYQHAQSFDALISTVGGDSVFKYFSELNEDDYRYGFEQKFLSQIRLLEVGEKYIQDGTLTAAQAANFYVKSVEGSLTGKMFRAWGNLPYSPE